MQQLLTALAVALTFSASNALALNVNQASEADLDGLRGLGPATTRLILAEREKAPFASWGDLLARVKGLGPGNAKRLSADGLTVNGELYDGTAGRKPAKKAVP